MDKIEEKVLPGFIFKEKCIGLKDFAKKYDYTYESARVNWENIKRIQLNNFDRQVIKIPHTNPSQIYIYELPSEKNSSLPNEQWKESSREGILVSNLGRLLVLKNHSYTRGTIDSKGYCRYGKFNKDKNQNQQILIHREVLMAFKPIENMKNYYVDHIDGNRSNNILENLRWVTPQQNSFYRDENHQGLHELLNEKIKTVGYDKVKQILQSI